MILAFVGHSLIPSKEKLKGIVCEQIRCHIANKQTVICYVGGYGDFDAICAEACKELKKEYPEMQIIYVTPYLTLAEQNKIKIMQSCHLCDASIYPPIENAPPKFAITKRNEWMMTNADLIIAYVKRNFGGAYQSLQIAKRRKKEIINICDFFNF